MRLRPGREPREVSPRPQAPGTQSQGLGFRPDRRSRRSLPEVALAARVTGPDGVGSRCVAMDREEAVSGWWAGRVRTAGREGTELRRRGGGTPSGCGAASDRGERGPGRRAARGAGAGGRAGFGERGWGFRPEEGVGAERVRDGL